jgi:hypothetical protein
MTLGPYIEREFDIVQSMDGERRYGAFGAPSTWTFQKVRNVEYPPDGVPRLLRERDAIPVSARVVWEQDGEEWISGRAVKWVRPVVFVLISDERHGGAGLWLPAADVRRL